MGVMKSGGFTIVESMLVLAISGVLIITLIAGVGTSINIQRYRDSVSAFESLIQTQYSELQNVRNDRASNWSCDATAVPVEGGAQTPGQSDCVLLGRYISVIDADITIASIVGYKTTSSVGNDVEVLRNDYTLGIASATVEKETLDWGTKISWPVSTTSPSSGNTTSRSLTIIMLRSPTSGTTYTFTDNTAYRLEDMTSARLKEPIVAADSVPGQGQQTICIEGVGLVVTGGAMAVQIAAYATGPSAVEIHSNQTLTGMECVQQLF